MNAPEEIKKRRLEILQWEKDNRNINNMNMRNGGACMYTPLPGKPYGCGVGRLLPVELCHKLDERGKDYNASPLVSEDFVQDLLPPEIKELGIDFLQDLQTLHDTLPHFNEKGLTAYGQETFDELVKKYCSETDLNILE